MISFFLGNSWTRFDRDSQDVSPEIFGELCQRLSIVVHYYVKKKNQAHPERKSRRVDYLEFDSPYAKFPSGLLGKVIQYLTDKGIEYQVNDCRRKFEGDSLDLSLSLPEPSFSEADYSFQEIAVSKAIEWGRGLLYYPTGSGKTIIMAKIIAKLDKRTLVIVPNLQLLNQTFEKFGQYFGIANVGIFGDSKKDLSKLIIIATQQSLHSMLTKKPSDFKRNIAKSFPIVFIDECHHIATAAIIWRKDAQGKWTQKPNIANTWWDILMAIDAYHKYGMSATLGGEISNDRFVLQSATGHVISSISISELVERKVLCGVKVIMLSLEHPRYSVWKSQYGEREVDGVKEKYLIDPGALDNNILENDLRNDIIAQIAHQKTLEGNKVLVLVDKVATHGKILRELISNSIFLHGSHSTKKREEGLAEFSKGGKTLIGTIFKEGFDFPAINVLIIAGGGKSSKALVQKIGRVLRTCEGKDRAEIFDFMDKDGSMCERHSEARLVVYKSEPKYEVVVVDGENYLKSVLNEKDYQEAKTKV